MNMLLVATLLATAASITASLLADEPATRPTARVNGWDPSWIRYDAHNVLVVEESPPTRAQVSFPSRPARSAADAPDPVAKSGAKALRIGEVNIVPLRFRDTGGEIVTALLFT